MGLLAIIADLIGLIAGAVVVWLGIKELTSVGSADEKVSEDDAKRLIELRKRLDKEKNEEIAEKLRSEADRFEAKLRAVKRTSLWNEDGTLRLTWQKTLVATRERLSEESERLNARSRANLRAGITISLVGLLVLVIVLLFFRPDDKVDDWVSLVIAYGPRFLLVIIIEIMATFFFRMYVSNELDIKHNKNEITNIEQKIAAGLMLQDKEGKINIIAEQLVKDVHNYHFFRMTPKRSCES